MLDQHCCHCEDDTCIWNDGDVWEACCGCGGWLPRITTPREAA